MINFRPLVQEDLELKFGQIPGICLNLNIDLNGIFSIYEYKGVEKCLYYDDGFGVIFYENGEYLGYKMFSLDKDLNLVGAQLDDFFYEKEEGIDTFIDTKTDVRSSLLLYKRPNNEVDRDGCNGILAFVQYNPYNDKRITLSYQQYKDTEEGKGFIFESTVNKYPFVITVENHVLLKQRFNLNTRKKRYLRVDGRRNDTIYDLLTINEYGLINFLKEGSYNLQRSDHISRYYRILKENFRDKYSITTYPIGFQHSFEEESKKMEKEGFRIKPSSEMIRIYNNQEMKEFEEYLDIAKSLENLSKTSSMEGSYLSLEL